MFEFSCVDKTELNFEKRFKVEDHVKIWRTMNIYLN